MSRFAVALGFAALLWACGSQKPSNTPPYAMSGTYLEGWGIPIRDSVTGRVIATTKDTVLLGRAGNKTNVRTFKDYAFVAEGTIDDADFTKVLTQPCRAEGCIRLGIVRSSTVSERDALLLVPPGFAVVDRSATFPIEGDIYEGDDCSHSKISGESFVEDEVDATSAELGPHRLQRTFSLTLLDENRHVALGGPKEARRRPNQAEVTTDWMCLRSIQVVGKVGTDLIVVDASYHQTILVAYDPRAAFRWYTTEASCVRDHPKATRRATIAGNGCR